MKKPGLFNWVALIGLCVPLSVLADIKQGTGTYIMQNQIKYEIIDSKAMTAGVAVQEQDCPTFVDIAETVTEKNGDGTTSVYTVTQINPEAFKGNKDIFKVKFANTITDIGARAFEGCPILTFEEFPEGLLTIGDYAFKGCNAIKRIKLAESTTTLGEGCFSYMENLQRAIMFSNVTELPAQIFIEDTQLEEVYLPENLLKIGNEAFVHDFALEEIKFPSTLEEIGDNAFTGGASIREGIKHIVLPASIKRIGEAFVHTPLVSADLSNLEVIPASAFRYCYDLRDIVFSDRLKSIGEYAFNCCAANAGRTMNELVLPNSLEYISENAFFESNILSLNVGDGVKYLPKNSCGTPKILTLGVNVEKIDPDAFDPRQLQIINVKAAVPPTVPEGFNLTVEQQRKITVIVPSEEAEELYKSHEYWKEFNIVVLTNSEVTVHLDGTSDLASAIYNTSKVMPADVTRLIVSGHLTDQDFAIIKNNMLSLMYLDMGNADNTVIPKSAFKQKMTLETVILPENLSRIEDEAFNGCTAMRIEELPDGIEFIGVGAFGNCQRINITRMPESLKELEYAAFSDCVSIRTLTFGDKLETLHGVSFSSCDNLEYVDMSRATKLKDLSYNTFYLDYALKTLLLPASVENIGFACISHTGLKNLELPASLKTLGDHALAGNDLRVLSFGEGLTELPDGVLYDNKKLLTVNLPSTLQSLNEGTFTGSKKISGISCRALSAPKAKVETFNDINTRTCILSVPSSSFFNYLSAIGWGMFSNIQNTLEIDLPEDVELTTVPEEDYLDLAEEIESEQRANELAEVPSRAMVEETQQIDSNSLLKGALFCKLQNGAVMASDKNEASKGHRIFIKVADDQPLTSVKVNEIEMIDQVVDNSFVLPAGMTGKLVINGGSRSRIGNIPSDELNSIGNVYDITGRCVLTNATYNQINRLDKGVYIFNGKKVLVK